MTAPPLLSRADEPDERRRCAAWGFDRVRMI